MFPYYTYQDLYQQENKQKYSQKPIWNDMHNDGMQMFSNIYVVNV